MLATQTANIIVPNAPAIPGLRFRGLGGSQDFALMAGLVNAAYQADGVPETSTAEVLAHYYANPKNLDPQRDVLIAEVNGEPACYSRVYWLDEAGGARIYRSTGFTHPAWRRKGLGTAVLAFNEARIRQIAEAHGYAGPRYFEVTVPDTQVGSRVLLEKFGYQTQRHFFIMARALTKQVDLPPLPSGVEIRPVVAGHMRAIWDAMEEAFRDHWGYTPRDEEDYKRWLTKPDTDTRLWQVAWDGDEVAGLALNYAEEDGSKAWTEPLAVRRPWRKRGLGRALLMASQAKMLEHGIKTAALEVDTQNPNQALHLYEGCGYEKERRWDLYRKEMS